MDAISELLQFLSPSARLDLKAVSLDHVLSLSGSAEGNRLLLASPPLLQSLLELTSDPSEAIALDAIRTLINLSADPEGARIILKTCPKIVEAGVASILDENSPLADPWTMLLSNLSRPEDCVAPTIDRIQTLPDAIHRLVTCFTRIGFNKRGARLDYLGPLFSNLSQAPAGRALLCDRETRLLQRLLPFTSHAESVLRRGGAVGLLKNVCFDSALHEWLLDEVDVLPYVLLPLAGPEEFDDEENEKFPPELQYLDPDKRRESDPDIRKMLLESLLQLCATRKGREMLRAKGAYEILRELHKWECTAEGDKNVLVACENVVDVLIRTEQEIGEEDLKKVEVPEHIVSKLAALHDVHET